MGHLVFVLLPLLLLLSCESNDLSTTDTNIISSHIIIGDDNRERVIGNYDSYNRAVGQLVFPIENNQNETCTATAIADRYLITAAHCLYQGNTLHKNGFFYPGKRSPRTMPFDRFPVLEVYHPRAFNPTNTLVSNSDHDIAIVHVGLDSQGRGLHQRVGSIGLWPVNEIFNQEMRTLGYPGDRGGYHQYQELDCLAFDSTDLRFATHCDVMGGQSGSPALFYHSASQSHYIRGVIASSGRVENYGAKLTPARKQMIDAIFENRFISFNQSSNLDWVHHRHPNDLRVRVIIHNKCQVDASVSYHLYDDGGQTDGFYLVRSGERVDLAQTRFGEYQIHIRNNNGHVYIGANGRNRHRVRGHDFTFATVNSSKWGDNVHTLCP